jgi:AcrR family transcriptional regulator
MKLAADEGSARRPYRMTARAQRAEETAERILDAAVEVFYERADLPLDEVAARAGVSTQTVIRRFGGREGLFAAGARREGERIATQRDTAGVGDVDGAVRVLVDHYEEMGDRVLALLAAEERSPAARQVTDQGRAMHRAWCERVFAPAFEGLTGTDRDRRLAQVVAVTDVFTWRLLRRDAGLPRPEVELAVRELLLPLIGDR